MAGNPTTPVPSVRVAWRPDQFNMVTNPGFETNTTGWVVTAGFHNEAATSVTRTTADSQSGSASATVVCTATYTSGVRWSFSGTTTFYDHPSHGVTYVALVWLKRVSGSNRARLRLGNAADYATLDITDLRDAWTAYAVRWPSSLGSANVELAVTNGTAEALTFRIDSVTVYADALSQVDNGEFVVNTTGWSVAGATIAAAATSITRITTDGFAPDVQTCATLVTTSTAGSGASFTLGARKFTSGRTYRFQVGIKRVSGGTAATLRLGSIGTSADRGTAAITLTTSWAWYTVDWTPSADRTDAGIAVSCSTSAGSVITMNIGHAEVFEAADDLRTDSGDISWGRSLDGIGSFSVRVLDDDGSYSPRNTSATLYGSLEAGKRVLGRATYGGALYPLFSGTVSTIEPDPFTGYADIVGEDWMGRLDDAGVAFGFSATATHADTRGYAIAAFVADEIDTADLIAAAMTTAHVSLADGVETNTYYQATDGATGTLALLADLNDATGTVHWIRPSPRANVAWVYTTVDRATLTDSSSDFTVDETDPAALLPGVRMTHEALENQQEVGWQAYESLPPPDIASGGTGRVVVARDRSAYAGSLSLDDEDPYLHFTDTEYGTDDDHPEMRWRYPHGWKGWKWRRRKKKGHKVPRRTKVFPDPFVPFTMAAGEVRRVLIDFAVPVADQTVDVDGPTGANDIRIVYVERRPTRLIFDLYADAADTVDYLEVGGSPYLPLDELDEPVDDHTSQTLRGIRRGPDSGTPYVPSLGDAQGIGEYRNWRWGEPRLRPQLVDSFSWPRTLTMDLTHHVTVTADRYHLTSVLFVVTGLRVDVTQGGLMWTATRDLEELPTTVDDWFGLDKASHGLDSGAPLAY